jgi:hypothetical protein
VATEMCVKGGVTLVRMCYVCVKATLRRAMYSVLSLLVFDQPTRLFSSYLLPPKAGLLMDFL